MSKVTSFAHLQILSSALVHLSPAHGCHRWSPLSPGTKIWGMSWPLAKWSNEHQNKLFIMVLSVFIIFLSGFLSCFISSILVKWCKNTRMITNKKLQVFHSLTRHWNLIGISCQQHHWNSRLMCIPCCLRPEKIASCWFTTGSKPFLGLMSTSSFLLEIVLPKYPLNPSRLEAFPGFQGI